MLSIAACSSDHRKGASEDEQQALRVHMLAAHQNNDLDEDYTELYESIKHTIHENRQMGRPETFALQPSVDLFFDTFPS